MKSLLSPLKRIIFLSFVLLTIFAGQKGCGCGNESNVSSQGGSDGNQSGAPVSSVKSKEPSLNGLTNPLQSVTPPIQSGEDLTNMKGLPYFVIKRLESNKNSTYLDLNLCYIDDTGAEALAKVLGSNTTLTSLNLGFNNIGDTGAVTLAKALEENSTLTSLNLHNTNIGDTGAVALAKALEGNSALTSLNLGYNKIGNTGAEALAKIFEGNTKLAFLGLHVNNISENIQNKYSHFKGILFQ